mmetsp:Transcript_18085/g.22227  ORF Transcript_18085/g.22227 Transcript_18085/m.22227 type:complete len:196 (-) Transcript_18085:412-999(-)
MATNSKVCLVLGAGPGLGYSLGKKWANMGHQVVVTRRRASDQEEIRNNIGENVVAMECDVTSAKQTEELVNAVEKDYGPIDTLLYNAGSGVFKTYENLSLDEFEKSFATNATGLLIAAQIICPRMEKRGGGVIGVTGATASLRGKPVTAGFAPAKAAQRMLAQSLARQLGPKDIHVFMLSSMVESKLEPLVVVGK